MVFWLWNTRNTPENNEQDSNTVPVTSSSNKQKQSNRNEPPTLEIGNTTQPEQKVNPENLERIMNSENVTLPSLRNIEWRKIKTETNKLNQVLLYISTNNITELNELIYAWVKLLCKKIVIPSKSTKKK